MFGEIILPDSVILWVGIAIALVALVALIVAIVGTRRSANKPMTGAGKQASAASASVMAAAPAVAGDAQLIAAITAAIACCMEDEDAGFTIRSVRRVSSRDSAWRDAGRREQIYSRF